MLYSDTCYLLLAASKEIDDLNAYAKSNRDLFRELKSQTSFLPDSAYARERLWYVEHETKTPPTCKICPKPVKWNNLDRKFQTYCSTKCTHNDPELRERLEQTNLERYGNRHSFAAPEIRAKHDATCLERYGNINGVSEEMKQRREATFVRKYGVMNPMLSPIVREKCKQTFLRKYGTTHPMKNTAIREKARIKALKYLESHPRLLKKHPENTRLINDPVWIKEQHYTNRRPLYDIAKEVGTPIGVLRKRMSQFGITAQRYTNNSFVEQQITEFVRSFYTNTIIENDRIVIKPLELDIVLPDLKIAIEVDGIYWHSELNGKDRHYHINKTNECEANNYHLIHIFETDWFNNREIVESRLRHILHNSAKIVYARKCQIVELTREVVSLFQNTTHLQGFANYSIGYGLMYEDKLVSCMTFGKSRFNKNVEYELLRYSSTLNTNVIGGASKLFKHFIKQYSPKSIISYSDRRFSQGNLYQQLGFKFLHNSSPNYFYFKSDDVYPPTLFSRQHFQKHKLPNLLETFSITMTEWDNMVENGYDRIWDCGNGVWLYT